MPENHSKPESQAKAIDPPKYEVKKLLNKALWLKLKSSRVGNKDLADIKARIDASSKRMGCIKAGRSIAVDLKERSWKDACDWAVSFKHGGYCTCCGLHSLILSMTGLHCSLHMRTTMRASWRRSCTCWRR